MAGFGVASPANSIYILGMDYKQDNETCNSISITIAGAVPSGGEVTDLTNIIVQGDEPYERNGKLIHASYITVNLSCFLTDPFNAKAYPGSTRIIIYIDHQNNGNLGGIGSPLVEQVLKNNNAVGSTTVWSPYNFTTLTRNEIIFDETVYLGTNIVAAPESRCMGSSIEPVIFESKLDHCIQYATYPGPFELVSSGAIKLLYICDPNNHDLTAVEGSIEIEFDDL